MAIAIQRSLEQSGFLQTNLSAAESAHKAAAILINDNHKTVNRINLTKSDENILSDIAESGLPPIMSITRGIDNLQRLILRRGSAIISIKVSEKKQSLYIVVDSISSQNITLREPSHGQQIIVKKEDFTRYLPDSIQAIQIDREFIAARRAENSAVHRIRLFVQKLCQGRR